MKELENHHLVNMCNHLFKQKPSTDVKANEKMFTEGNNFYIFSNCHHTKKINHTC